jgi:hypothetical protein
MEIPTRLLCRLFNCPRSEGIFRTKSLHCGSDFRHGSKEAQGQIGTAEPKRPVVRCQHVGSDTQSSRPHQPEEEQAADNAVLPAILDGHGAACRLLRGHCLQPSPGPADQTPSEQHLDLPF